MTIITVTTVGYREVHPLSRTGQGFTVVLLIGGVGAALYTFTLVATMVVEGGLPWPAAEAAPRTYAHHDCRPLHHLRLRADRPHRRPAVPSAADSVRRGGAGPGPGARRHRGRRPRRGGGCQSRGRAAPGGHRARARADRGRRHRRRERVCGAQRSRDAPRSLHRRPCRDRGRDDQAEACGRRPRDLALSDRRDADRADRHPAGRGGFHGTRDELGQPRAGDGGDHHRSAGPCSPTSRFWAPISASGTA